MSPYIHTFEETELIYSAPSLRIGRHVVKSTEFDVSSNRTIRYPVRLNNQCVLSVLVTNPSFPDLVDCSVEAFGVDPPERSTDIRLHSLRFPDGYMNIFMEVEVITTWHIYE
jgi:hypothetical protein